MPQSLQTPAADLAAPRAVDRAPTAAANEPLKPLAARETLAVLRDVLVPLAARGLLARRPRVTRSLDRLEADKRAVARLEELRAAHGSVPALLRVPGRNVAIVLSADDARAVLEGSPEPFATASREKRAALARFQPHGVLISDGRERAERPDFNERVLDTPHAVHHLAGDFLAPIRQEAASMLQAARARGELAWPLFASTWWRLARTLVLGTGARDDHELTELLARLRADANWAYLKPNRRAVRTRFLTRLREHLARAEPGSLAGVIAATATHEGIHPEEIHPEDQVAHWLFAFDAAGMASFRALALVDAHPEARRAIGAELPVPAAAEPQLLPRLRACVLESVRLWPTTFSHGPAVCPGQNLVLFVTSSLLADLLSAAEFHQTRPAAVRQSEPMPATLSPFDLRFEVVPPQ